VYRWAGQMLLDAASLRRRGEIEALAATNARKRMRTTGSEPVAAKAVGG
jgi:hypothetical protein